MAHIKKYFERFPGIRAYMDETKAFCKQNGYVLTLFGRKRHYPDITNSNPSICAFNERASINARLQGTAADIIRRAMIRMDDELKKHKLTGHMLLQVHDELIFEVPDGEVEKTLPVVTQVMEHAALPAVSLSVPLHVDARGDELGRGALVFVEDISPMRLLRIAVFTLTAFGFAPIAGLAQAPLPPEQHYGEIADPSVWPFSAIGRVNRTTRSDERGFSHGNPCCRKLGTDGCDCLYQDEGVRSVIHFVTAVANGVPAEHGIAKRVVISPQYVPHQPFRVETVQNDLGHYRSQRGARHQACSGSIADARPSRESGPFMHVGYWEGSPVPPVGGARLLGRWSRRTDAHVSVPHKFRFLGGPIPRKSTEPMPS